MATPIAALRPVRSTPRRKLPYPLASWTTHFAYLQWHRTGSHRNCDQRTAGGRAFDGTRAGTVTSSTGRRFNILSLPMSPAKSGHGQMVGGRGSVPRKNTGDYLTHLHSGKALSRRGGRTVLSIASPRFALAPSVANQQGGRSENGESALPPLTLGCVPE